MDSLIYISLATRGLDQDELAELAQQSAGRNRSLDVTGFLYASYGVYIQYLEGPADHLDGLMSAIRRDPRHDIVEKIHFPMRKTRRFPRWSMRIVEMSGLDDAELEAQLEIALQGVADTRNGALATEWVTVLLDRLSARERLSLGLAAHPPNGLRG